MADDSRRYTGNGGIWKMESSVECDVGAISFSHKATTPLALPQIVEQIQARDLAVRNRAIQQLFDMQIGPETLLELLTHPHSFVRSAAAEALGNSAGPLPPEAIDALLSTIDDSNVFVCAAAIRALGEQQIGAAQKQIVACLDDSQSAVVRAAIIAVTQLEVPNIEERLVEFLDSEHASIRATAAMTLGIRGYHAAIPKLLESLEAALQSQERSIRKAGSYIVALVRLQARDVIPHLIDIAQNTVGLRTIAVDGLAALQATEAIPVLEHLQHDASKNLRKSINRLRRMATASSEERQQAQEQALHKLTKIEKKILQDEQHQGRIQRQSSGSLERVQRQAQREYRKQQTFKRIPELHVGMILTGYVAEVVNFGAFVELGDGATGLVHTSELSWGRVSSPAKLLEPGQEVRVMIIELDPAGGRIGLSMRRLHENPWETIGQRYELGQLVHGPITTIAPYGIFVEIENGIEGLVHISEIDTSPDIRLKDMFQKGQIVNTAIIRLEPEHRRIGLSLRCVAPNNGHAALVPVEA
jgi:predicted RNA-binding protein with RPS1 domain/HEAT repeat protein